MDIKQNSLPVCGIIMPISTIDGCSESHWIDVRDILEDSISEAGFEANLVSNGADIGVIQKRIIQNLYENPIVVCDVSGKNPNVMFELGLRLAFDKPTIIIKDDRTSYSFDTSPIEHLEYPRDLRFNKIEEFKSKLVNKIIKTFEKSQNELNYSTFLKHFGEFKVAVIEQKEVPQEEYVLEELKSIRRQLDKISTVRSNPTTDLRLYTGTDVCLKGYTEEQITPLLSEIILLPNVLSYKLYERSTGHFHLRLKTKTITQDSRSQLKMQVKNLVKENLKKSTVVDVSDDGSESDEKE